MVHSFDLFDQEAEVEYVEGDYELEEEEELEDDIEDMGDLLKANDFGINNHFSINLSILIFVCHFSLTYQSIVYFGLLLRVFEVSTSCPSLFSEKTCYLQKVLFGKCDNNLVQR